MEIVLRFGTLVAKAAPVIALRVTRGKVCRQDSALSHVAEKGTRPLPALDDQNGGCVM